MTGQSQGRVVAQGVDIVPVADLARDPALWDDLVARARDPHPHYSRHVLAAHRDAGLAPDDLAAVVVRRGDRLDAVLPFRMTHDLCGLGRSVARPFLSPFVTSTAPLVADGPDLPDTLARLVAGLRDASGGRVWRWPLLSAGSALGRGLIGAMAAAGWRHGVVQSFERPVLDRRADYGAFLVGHPNRARFKDLGRRRRRLAESGSLAYETASEGPALSLAVEAFLALEKAGWKGEAGTALACRASHAAFARQVFARQVFAGQVSAPSGDPVRVRADLLRLDGRPLAISLALVTGATACLLKTAYDETARANAPGLVLEAEIVRALHETAFADRLDSATLPGSALEGLYTERETIAEIVAVPDGGHGFVSLDRRLRLARFEHAARAEAKRRLGRR